MCFIRFCWSFVVVVDDDDGLLFNSYFFNKAVKFVQWNIFFNSLQGFWLLLANGKNEIRTATEDWRVRRMDIWGLSWGIHSRIYTIINRSNSNIYSFSAWFLEVFCCSQSLSSSPSFLSPRVWRYIIAMMMIVVVLVESIIHWLIRLILIHKTSKEWKVKEGFCPPLFLLHQTHIQIPIPIRFDPFLKFGKN